MQTAWLSAGILLLWPLDGLIVGMMLGPFRRRPWPAMAAGLIGTLAAFVVVDRQMALGLSRVGLMAVAIPCTYFALRRFIGRRNVAEFGVLVPMLGICALIAGPTALARSYLLQALSFHGPPPLTLALTTVTATFTGYAVFAPLVLLFTQYCHEAPSKLSDRFRTGLIVGVYSLVVTAAFSVTRYPVAYLIPLSLILVAHAVDFMGVILVILVTMVVSVLMTFTGHGPISAFAGSVNDKILLLQAFLCCSVVATLPFSAMMSERDRLRKSLSAALLEAKVSNEAKSIFLATMSHEIRTPLNGILGMAQAIAMGELSPVQRERIKVVRNSGESLLSLLNDILDISKIEAGKLTLESIEFSLSELLATVIAQYEAAAAGKNLTLNAAVGAARGVYLGDPSRIRQIIQNLVSNAIKFTDAGAVTITAAHDGETLTIAVKDTGIGIPADKVGHLFQKFRQVDDSITRRYGGTGLGLSICRELAEAMGGSIFAASGPGPGATFTIVLPIKRLRDEADPSARTDQVCDRAPELALRVLAAEDNPSNQLVLKALLGAAGIIPTVVDNGELALSAGLSGAWDLILMDIQMPVIDGIAATKAIRKAEAERGLPRTKIIALSADGMPEQVQECLKAGMDGHLSKPIVVGKLFDLLASVQTEVGHAEVDQVEPLRASA